MPRRHLFLLSFFNCCRELKARPLCSCLQFLMELTFLEAVMGADKDLSVNIEDTCPRCNGGGSEPGTKVSVCHYCNGTGMVSFPLYAVQSPKHDWPVCGAPCRSPSAPVHT